MVKGRTTFVITHRLSTIRNADLILVLGKGEIVERGTRSELLSRNGYYKRIHDLQISSQDVDTLFEKDEPTFELQPAKDPTGEAEEGPASSHETALDDEMKYPAYSVRQVMARLLGYSRPYSHLFMVVIVCMIAWIGVGAAWPWIIKLAIDGYAVGGDGDQSGLNLIVVILLLAALVHSVSGYFLETVWAFLGQRVLYALRMSMVNHLQRLSIAFYDRSQVGRVMSRLQNDVRELSVFWYMIASTTPNVLTSGIIVVVMFAINVQLALITMALAVLLLVPAAIFWQRYGGYVNRCVNDIRRRPSQPLIQWRFHPHTVHRGRRLRSTQGPSDA